MTPPTDSLRPSPRLVVAEARRVAAEVMAARRAELKLEMDARRARAATSRVVPERPVRSSRTR